jgi:hypothetical protein
VGPLSLPLSTAPPPVARPSGLACRSPATPPPPRSPPYCRHVVPPAPPPPPGRTTAGPHARPRHGSSIDIPKFKGKCFEILSVASQTPGHGLRRRRGGPGDHRRFLFHCRGRSLLSSSSAGPRLRPRQTRPLPIPNRRRLRRPPEASSRTPAADLMISSSPCSVLTLYLRPG